MRTKCFKTNESWLQQIDAEVSLAHKE